MRVPRIVRKHVIDGRVFLNRLKAIPAVLVKIILVIKRGNEVQWVW